MNEVSLEKYSPEEWKHFRERFNDSILKDTEIAKLGQNVGISWPFKGKGETAEKYIEYDFEQLQTVPGLIGKPSRIKTLMNILRETLAFDDPFSDMVNTVESEGEEDHTFERILAKLNIPPNYPSEFVHLAPDSKDLLEEAAAPANTLIEVIHFAQKIAPGVVGSEDLKSFLNGLAHQDETGIAKYVPYRRGIRGLHLPEAIGLIAGDLSQAAQLRLLEQAGASLGEEEQQQLAKTTPAELEVSIREAVEKVSQVTEWFTADADDLQQAFKVENSPERYFIMINDPRRESLALELAKLHLGVGDPKKTGFLGRLFGR